MSLADTLAEEIRSTLSTKWKERNGASVPEADSVGLAANEGVKLDATVLYADLAGSTNLVQNHSQALCAKVYKAFLGAACRIIRHKEGVITSFDGDRVMAVFVGDAKNTSAARCALAINHTVRKQLTPQLRERFSDLPADFQLGHGVGVDTGTLFAVRTGIRRNNDLAWIGSAANIAAKLSEQRGTRHRSFITAAVFNALKNDLKNGDAGQSMWEHGTLSNLGLSIYRSSWTWGL